VGGVAPPKIKANFSQKNSADSGGEGRSSDGQGFFKSRAISEPRKILGATLSHRQENNSILYLVQ